MKLSEYKNDYYTFTGKLSDINRQLAFAGIAIIWIFKKSNGSEINISNELITPAILIVISLAFDLFHYIYQSIVWSIFYTYYKKKNYSEDRKIQSPEYLNYLSWFFFFSKVVLIIMAYYKLLLFLYQRFN